MTTDWEGRGSLVNYVEPALQTDEVVPPQSAFLRDLHESFRALAGAAHEFFAGRGSVADAAVNFQAD